MINLKQLLIEHRANSHDEHLLKDAGYMWYGKEYYHPNTDHHEDGFHVTFEGDKFIWSHYDTGQMDLLVEEFNTIEALLAYHKKWW